jgi:hypothetical protein
MNIDWEREAQDKQEFFLITSVLRELIRFFQSFHDKTVRERYVADHDARIQLRKVITPIVLSVQDSTKHVDGGVLHVDLARLNQGIPEANKVDQSFVESILYALVSINYVQMQQRTPEHLYVLKLLPAHPLNDDASPDSEPNIRDSADRLDELVKGRRQAEKVRAEELAYSRPLDVHTSSDHPEVTQLIDALFGEHFRGGNAKIRKKHLKTILLDLFVAWTDDPRLKIAFRRDVDAYHPKSRYNALHISKTCIEVVDTLIQLGYLDQVKGIYNKETGEGRASRIWATPILIELFKSARFTAFDIDSHYSQECIVLRDFVTKTRKFGKSGKTSKAELNIDIEYKDSDYEPIVAMRAQLQAYNNLLRRSFIDIPVLDKPFIELDDSGSDQDRHLFISQHDKFVRRIFNRGSWEHGGRFWGGWWQRCPKRWREAIFIDDCPVMEIDYSGLHIVLLYAEEGLNYWDHTEDDPYTITLPALDIQPDMLRSICKQLVLVALNASSEEATFQAFRKEAETGSMEKRLNNTTLKTILDQLRQKHHAIGHRFASDAGIALMRTDSEITANIIDYFTKIDVPILTIHDSYLVPVGHEDELQVQMFSAFELVTGVKAAKLKEATHDPRHFEPQSLEDAQGMDHEAWEAAMKWRFNPRRAPRYQSQYEKHKEWFAQLLGLPQ